MQPLSPPQIFTCRTFFKIKVLSKSHGFNGQSKEAGILNMWKWKKWSLVILKEWSLFGVCFGSAFPWNNKSNHNCQVSLFMSGHMHKFHGIVISIIIAYLNK